MYAQKQNLTNADFRVHCTHDARGEYKRARKKPFFGISFFKLKLSMTMEPTVALAKKSASANFEEIKIERNVMAADHVKIQVKFCGICNYDVTCSNDKFSFTRYPCVPGHEIAGVVLAVGGNVSEVGVGQKVGVGCVSDACLRCAACGDGSENYCEKGMTMTIGAKTQHGHIQTF